ncbi:MAG: hypothetical protein IJQ23_06525 [Clostridia bacterium]|nr:hypothetical protein [Clostridia bacterium]
MKNFADAVKLFFVIAGAVLGAGFLSGGELVGFFNSKSAICLTVSGALFFVGFAFIGAKQDGFTKMALIIAGAVFSSAMLTALDEISWETGVIKGFPAVSVLSIIAFHFWLSNSVKKLEKANYILIPFAVAVVVAAAFFSEPVGAPSPNTGVKDGVNAVLYACMNLFVALPSVSIAARGKKRSVRVIAALTFAVFFVALAYIILRVSPSTALPLMDMAFGTPFYPFIVAAVFIGSFTSLLCCLYPLKNLISERTADKKHRNLYCFLLYALLFLLSRAGIAAIIKYCYPFVGALGLFSIVKSFFGIKRKAEGDTMEKRSALCRERKRPKSKNSPKKNTAII